jgi:hypothetical protein
VLNGRPRREKRRHTRDLSVEKGREIERERGRGGRDVGGGVHGGGRGGSACTEVGAAAHVEGADWRCARANWWRAQAVETE